MAGKGRRGTQRKRLSARTVVHSDVRYAGFHEDLSLGFETLTPVEGFCAGLGVEEELFPSGSVRDKALHNRCPYPVTAPGFDHRHAANLPVRQQPSCTDHFSGGACCHDMHGCCVTPIPFEIGRYALLVNKDPAADCRECFGRILPVDKGNPVAGAIQIRCTRVRRDRSVWTRFQRSQTMPRVPVDSMHPVH